MISASDTAGEPVLELSSAASLAMVVIAPPEGGMVEVTVTASGPLAVLEHTLSAVDC